MLELPEVSRIADQANGVLIGKQIALATRGSHPHRWLFSNREEDQMSEMLRGRSVTGVSFRGKALDIRCGSEAVLTFDEMGGQMRYIASDCDLPAKWHFLLRFEDGSCFYAMVQGWGFVGVDSTVDLDAKRLLDARLMLTDPAVDAAYVHRAVAEYPERDKKSVKAMITSGAIGVGFGNGYLHDLLFLAKIQPTRKVGTLRGGEIDRLFLSMSKVLHEAVECGGRDMERDLFGNPGGYRPILDKRMADRPCPICATPIKKISFLGGSCYFCPSCQK